MTSRMQSEVPSIISDLIFNVVELNIGRRSRHRQVFCVLACVVKSAPAVNLGKDKIWPFSIIQL